MSIDGSDISGLPHALRDTGTLVERMAGKRVVCVAATDTADVSGEPPDAGDAALAGQTRTRATSRPGKRHDDEHTSKVARTTSTANTTTTRSTTTRSTTNPTV